jgi:hypothetical protein
MKLWGVEADPEIEVKAVRVPEVEIPCVTLHVIDTDPFPGFTPAEFD